MRLASFIASTACGILALCSVSDVAAWNESRSGWYIGGDIGSNRASDMDQEGWNRETTCYPTDACFDADPVPAIPGYRWRYDIDAAPGAAFELLAGRIFNRTRLELSLARRKNNTDQMFRGITYYDGTPGEKRRGSTVASNARNSIDNLTVHTLALNAYYDFPDVYRGISPYVGLGLGPAFVKVSGVHFSTHYEDTSGNAQAYDPPLSFYDSRQEADLRDTVLAGHLHAGADCNLKDRILLGLKLTYSMVGDIASAGGYSVHPFHERDPDFTNHNTFTGPHYRTLSFTVKFLFGHSTVSPD